MSKKIKIAVIFNDFSEENQPFSDQGHSAAPLSFKPYFEEEVYDPIKEYSTIVRLIESFGYEAYFYNIQDDLEKLIYHLHESKPDLIFNFAEIFKDNAKLEMNIAGIFEMLQIPFTGSSSITLANCQNKTFVKKLLKSADLPTPPFTFYKQHEFYEPVGLSFPLIVKPAFEDASTGIENDSIVTDLDLLFKRLEHVYNNFYQAALVEEFIDGRELNVAIMGNDNPIVFPISEISFTKLPDHLYKIVSYQAKWEFLDEAYHKTRPICPAKLPFKVEQQVKEIALKAYKLLEVRDYARIDIRLSKDKHPYILEINPNPHIDEGVGFMRSAEAGGFPYEAAIKKIIEFAIERGKLKN